MALIFDVLIMMMDSAAYGLVGIIPLDYDAFDSGSQCQRSHPLLLGTDTYISERQL
jgi:hypothetical protein